jgi:hypothetical protein
MRTREKVPYKEEQESKTALLAKRDIEMLLFGLSYQHGFLSDKDYIMYGTTLNQYDYGDYWITDEKDYNDAMADLRLRIEYWEWMLERADS